MTSLGKYPEISLATARERRQEARALLTQGVDPVADKRARKTAQEAQEAQEATLEKMADQWLANQGWMSNYRAKVEGRLRRHILPQLGQRPITEITAPELLTALRRIEQAGTIETARRCRQHVSRVYRFAIASGLATTNPADGLEEALASKPRAKHFTTITDPNRLGGLLRAIETFDGTPQVRAALRLAPMLLARPGELRRMEWSELDLDEAMWSIPVEKMKMDRDRLVPLPHQAVAILRELAPWTSGGRYVFPGGRSAERPMSENALTAALRRIGYSGDEVTIHGMRATAHTLLVQPDLLLQRAPRHAPGVGRLPRLADAGR